MRVLYLAMSPDAETIVTGAGDETLRFWKVFPRNNKKYSIMGLNNLSNVKESTNSKVEFTNYLIR